MCLWTAYADPVARERALALLRPALADIAPSAAPFKLGAASAHREDVGGQPVLFVEGSLANATKRKRRAPVLRVSLIGDDGQPLYSWKTKPAVAEVAPGADVAYRTRLASPPPAFKSIEVSLAD